MFLSKHGADTGIYKTTTNPDNSMQRTQQVASANSGNEEEDYEP
jgi:hypothetical protein